MNAKTLTLADATERAEILFRRKHTETAAHKLDEGLQEMQRNMAVVLILSSDNREEAILALDTLIDAIKNDLRANTQSMINDGYDKIRKHVHQSAEDAAKPAMEAFNTIMKAKEGDESRPN